MKIEKLILKNFKGIEGVQTYELPHVGVLMGENGIGKSTVLQGVRYAVTGALPDGDPINRNSDSAYVGVQVSDGTDTYQIVRSISRTKPSAWRVNGVRETGKAVDEIMEHITGVPARTAALVSSGELIRGIGPDELGKLLLSYIPEKLKRDEVKTFFPEMTPGMSRIIDGGLSTEIMMDDINAFAETLKGNRKDMKKRLQQDEALLASLKDTAPEESKEEIQEEIRKLTAIDAEYSIWLEKVKEFKRAVDTRKRHLKMLSDAKAEYESIAVSKDDPALTKRCEDTIAFLNASIAKQKGALMAANTAVQRMENTLKALNTSVCPISDKIVCHEDKTVAKNELAESIRTSKEGMKQLEESIRAAEEKLRKCQAWLDRDNTNRLQTARKNQLAKQVSTLEHNVPVVPADPGTMVKKDTSAEMSRLNKLLDQWNSFEKHGTVSKRVNEETVLVSDLDKLCKALADRGPVKKAVIEKYLGLFNDEINERTHSHRPDVNFRFIPGNRGGIVMEGDFGKGFLPFNSLSSGEKAYGTFMLMDLMAQLTGIRLLLIDDMDVCDSTAFRALAATIRQYSDDYDHILVAAVNHPDTEEVIRESSFEQIRIEHTV